MVGNSNLLVVSQPIMVFVNLSIPENPFCNSGHDRPRTQIRNWLMTYCVVWPQYISMPVLYVLPIVSRIHNLTLGPIFNLSLFINIWPLKVHFPTFISKSAVPFSRNSFSLANELYIMCVKFEA